MYQPDYTFDSRHNPKSAFEKVLKASGVPLLEVEINEIQDIQNTLRSKLFRELLTSGFMSMVPATVDSNKIRTGRMFALIDGNPVEVSDTSITLPSPPSSGARDDLVILEAWRQVVTQDDTITENGGEETNAIENGIADERLDVETSRRVQWRWRIRVIENATSVDSPSVGAYQKQYEGEEIYVANDPSTYDGDIYALPLFVVNRSGSLTLDQITDLRPKAELKQFDLSSVDEAIEDLSNLIEQYKTTLEQAIETIESGLSQNLINHINSTNVHGATSEATANRIAMRDSGGRLKAAKPVDDDHVARYRELKDLDELLSEEIQSVYNDLESHKASGDHDDRYYTIGQLDSIIRNVLLDHWTVLDNGSLSQQDLRDVTYADGLWVAVGADGKILTSTNGITWTSRTSGTTNVLYGVAYADGLWVVVGFNGTILTSPDGISWTERTSGTSDSLSSVTYADGLWVVVGAYGKILTSQDGITWTSRNSGTTLDLSGVAYADGLWVVVGFNGTILTSPDGITWTSRTSGTSFHLRDAIYADDLWVVVGFNGTILTSPDGITWTSRTSGTAFHLLGVTYANGFWVAVGLYGKIRTSRDGISWTERINGTSSILYGVAYANGLWVAVGADGTILTSPSRFTIP